NPTTSPRRSRVLGRPNPTISPTLGAAKADLKDAGQTTKDRHCAPMTLDTGMESVTRLDMGIVPKK
ncbi:hypothetical protein BaRGS_00025824, partial [Batillaria attramentaria]